jgi:hypothetical protein
MRSWTTCGDAASGIKAIRDNATKYGIKSEKTNVKPLRSATRLGLWHMRKVGVRNVWKEELEFTPWLSLWSLYTSVRGGKSDP